MRKIVYLLLTFLGPSAMAQTSRVIDPQPILECQYRIMETDDTLNNDNYNEDWGLLRIGKKASLFYNMKTFYVDSLCSTPGGDRLWGDMMVAAIRSRQYNSMPGAKTSINEYVYKNWPDSKITVADQVATSYFTYEEDYMPQDWVMSDSTKAILGYTCQKAECDFRGRHYIAWFSTEIPLCDGPWKFNGLPGLILEVYDSKMFYHFIAVGIRQTEVQPLMFYKYHDYVETTLRKFASAKRKERTIISAQMSSLGIGNISAGDGKDVPVPGGMEKW